MPASLSPLLEAQQAPLKAALSELVRIPSVCNEGDGRYPFGAAVDQALRKALQIAGDLGFRTHYGDGGYYGYAEIGEGVELVGVLGHLDVVPPGNWRTGTPDRLIRLRWMGTLYDRGTQDDKGPLLAALFAVKALMDAGVKFNKRVRFIFGTDEETLWRCINRYKEKEELPGMGFSPDARFPLIFAEKGLLQLHLEGANRSGLRIAGGSAFNAVPDTMFYEGERQDDLARKLDALGFAYTRKPNGIEIHGKAAHAMIPEEGINAIARLCIALRAIGIESKAVDFIAQEIGEDPNATRHFWRVRRRAVRQAQVQRGHDRSRRRGAALHRLPHPGHRGQREIVVAKLSAAAARYGLEYKEFDWLAPIYLPKDHFMIETLMRVYRQVSGDAVSRTDRFWRRDLRAGDRQLRGVRCGFPR